MDAIDAPLDAAELATRWRAMCADPAFEELVGRVELTEWGEITMTQIGKTHGLVAMRVAKAVEAALGGHVMAAVGILTSMGIRAPDIACCSDAWLAAHPEEMPLSAAPELCIEIASASNALPRLREKAAAYVRAGASEAWLVFPDSKRLEVYGRAGLQAASEFAVEISPAFAKR